MNQDVIRRTFERVYNNARNFMTPDILRFGIRGHFIYELSSGRGIEPGTTIFGVSVLELDEQKRPSSAMKRRDLSGCYPTRALAHRAIDRLKEPTLEEKVNAKIQAAADHLKEGATD